LGGASILYPELYGEYDGLKQLVALWERWRRGDELGTGFAPFKHVFAQLRALRPWGAQDRIPDETIEYWREELRHAPDRSVRTEVELWFYKTPSRRQQASQSYTSLVTAVGGTVIHQAVIPEIAYHGLLIDLPAAALPDLMERREVALALAFGCRLLPTGAPRTPGAARLQTQQHPSFGACCGDAAQAARQSRRRRPSSLATGRPPGSAPSPDG
jgi:hypothetical protein